MTSNMTEKYGINVYSEIGNLKTVLLHRPGDELANLSPDLLERLLFDDTPDLAVAQKEHDFFAQTFRNLGVEVLLYWKISRWSFRHWFKNAARITRTVFKRIWC